MDNILLIDSEELGASLMSKYLSKNDYDVMTVAESSSLGVKIKVSKPDIIIVNGEMKNESPFALCRKVKEMPEGAFIPILILCADDGQSSQTRAFEAGADDVLLKNTGSQLFLSKVKSLLRIKHLSDQLKNQYNEIEAKNKLLDMQLKMAMQVQRSLIREQDFMQNDVRFISKYIPALDIGGDFYDIIKLDNKCIAVVICDVSGHGISAALLTAMLKMMVRNLAFQSLNPSQLLYNMNNEFFNIFEDRSSEVYACMFYAVIDTEKRRIYYSNAGEPLPMHLHFKDMSTTELECSGTPVGMIRDSVYEDKVAVFEKDDIVVFYTDGLADNLYRHNSDKFYETISRVLSDPLVNYKPEKILESLTGLFVSFETDINKKYEQDDVSIILCKM